MSTTVTGGVNASINFTETLSNGFLANIPEALQMTLKSLFRVSGVTADEVDGIYAATLTFVASTPQSLDLTTLTDVFGNAITAARARLVAIRVNWTTNGVPLLVGGAASNEWLGLVAAGGITKVYPSSSINNGFSVWAAPQTTAMAIGSTNKALKLDPQTAAGTVDIIIATCSS